jgi:hypothetical protein
MACTSLDRFHASVEEGRAEYQSSRNAMLPALQSVATVLLRGSRENRPARRRLPARRYRKDRRPTLPIERPFVFYPRYVGDLLKKHFTLVHLIWRYGKLGLRLKRDPEARNYMDLALTSVTDDDSERCM